MSNIRCVYGSIKVLFSCPAVPLSTTRGPVFPVGSAGKHKHKVGAGALQWDGRLLGALGSDPHLPNPPTSSFTEQDTAMSYRPL